MLKTQLHIHVKGDFIDNIKHTWKDLIDHASKLNFNVLAITCHKKIFFPLQAKKYAKTKKILLIKGVEISLNKQHIIILNVHKDAEKIKTFEDLKSYKNTHKESLIIAPHPYFPSNRTLKNNLEKHIDLFDAIEFNYFYTKQKDYNKKAAEIAKKYAKPLLGTSDCHILKYLDRTYTELDIENPPNTIPNLQAVFSAIRSNKITIKSHHLTNLDCIKILGTMLIRKTTK